MPETPEPCLVSILAEEDSLEALQLRACNGRIMGGAEDGHAPCLAMKTTKATHKCLTCTRDSALEFGALAGFALL